MFQPSIDRKTLDFGSPPRSRKQHDFQMPIIGSRLKSAENKTLIIEIVLNGCETVILSIS